MKQIVSNEFLLLDDYKVINICKPEKIEIAGQTISVIKVLFQKETENTTNRYSAYLFGDSTDLKEGDIAYFGTNESSFMMINENGDEDFFYFITYLVVL